MLTAAVGGESRLDKTPDRIRVETDLPEGLAPVTRAAVLTALAIADRYGHARTHDGDTVWAELDREVRQ